MFFYLWYILEFSVWSMIKFFFASVLWYLKIFVLDPYRHLSDEVTVKYLITSFVATQKTLVFVSKSNLKWISLSFLFHPSFLHLSLPLSSLSWTISETHPSSSKTSSPKPYLNPKRTMHITQRKPKFEKRYVNERSMEKIARQNQIHRLARKEHGEDHTSKPNP